MNLHHKKHHQAYVDNLNKALSQFTALEATNVSARVSLLQAIRFNGGGHVNHTIFWDSLVPKSSYATVHEASGELEKAIEASFGSIERMQKHLLAEALAVQGSGWAWLGYDAIRDAIAITTTANQDTLHSTHKLIPLLGIDVWVCKLN